LTEVRENQWSGHFALTDARLSRNSTRVHSLPTRGRDSASVHVEDLRKQHQSERSSTTTIGGGVDMSTDPGVGRGLWRPRRHRNRRSPPVCGGARRRCRPCRHPTSTACRFFTTACNVRGTLTSTSPSRGAGPPSSPRGRGGEEHAHARRLPRPILLQPAGICCKWACPQAAKMN